MMTPMSGFRKMSLLPNLLNVSRSQSDTSYDGLASVLLQKRGRRSSEWTDDNQRMILRPLQLNLNEQKEHNGLLYRRLSRHYTSKTHPAEELVSRSYSVKSVKKLAETRQRHRGSSIPSDSTTHAGGVKVKERTISNRSLPLPGDESDYCRLRNFSITSKGVVNRGDSFRCKSNPRVPKAESQECEVLREKETTPVPSQKTVKEVCAVRKSFKVLLVGASGVGKSSIWKQFLTSEYICANEVSSDQEVDRAVTVVLNTEESQMDFEKFTFHEETSFAFQPDHLEPDAYVIVYSVTDRRSYTLARHILTQLEGCVDTKAVILVGNKTDLARSRLVSTDEGRSLAKDRGCKFIETSVVINHQVDELLVGTLSQIRIKAKVADKLRKKRDSGSRRSSIYSGSKASGVLKKILRRACIKSKSCDNLHVL